MNFHHSNRLSRNRKEGEVYFSGKLKLYAFKVEASVKPNSIASAFRKLYPSSVLDLTILHERLSKLKARLKKRDDENYDDDFYSSDKFPNS